MLLTLAAGAALLAGCSDSGTGTAADATVRFNVATSTGTAAGAALDVSGGPETFTDGTNTLVVESAQMVLRDIDFHFVETATCTEDGSDDGSVDGGNAKWRRQRRQQRIQFDERVRQWERRHVARR